MRTLEDLKREKDTLFRKHPALRDARLLPLRETVWSYPKLSAFIERCFNHDYGNDSRIRFTPEFLEWNMPVPLGVCALDDRDRWLGCVLSFSGTYRHDGETRGYAIETGLSTIPEMRGRGFAQLLDLTYNETRLASGSGFSVYWLDSRQSSKGNSNLILERKGETLCIQPHPLIGKSLDCRKARVHGGLNAVAYAAVWTAQQVFPSRRGRLFPGGYRLAPYSAACMDGYLALIEAVDRRKRFRRVYDREELTRLLNFHKNAFHTLCYSLNDGGGTPWALLYGYKLPLKDGVWTFCSDGMIFHPELTWRLKRLFLSECEGILRDEEGCIGVTLVGTAAEEPLWKYGYVPFESQGLGFELHAEPELTAHDLRGLRIELR